MTTAKTEPRPFSEHMIDDLWRLRQESKKEEDRAAAMRRSVEEELFRRFDEQGATRLVLSNGGHVDLVTRNTGWAYDAKLLTDLGSYLLSRSLIREGDWNLTVQWVPKVDGNRIRGLRKLGQEVNDMINDARMGRTGRPGLDGPKLEEMG